MSGARGPAVAVCIPVYNCAAYLGQAIESVLAQTRGDFELVVLDNASTDGTAAVLAGYRDPRLRVFANDRTVGMGENWNRAIGYARAPLIKILPADDVLRPDCLERQAGILERPGNEGIAMVSCDREVIDDRGRVLHRRSFRGARGRVGGREAIRRVVRSGGNPIGEPGAVLLRAEALAAAGAFTDRIPLVLDLDLWLRVLLLGDLYVIREPLCAFRVSSVSESVGIAGRQGAQYRAFVEETCRDPRFGLGSADRFAGTLACAVNARLKQLFYRLYVRRSS